MKLKKIWTPGVGRRLKFHYVDPPLSLKTVIIHALQWTCNFETTQRYGPGSSSGCTDSEWDPV